jgi:hypothetical protein
MGENRGSSQKYADESVSHARARNSDARRSARSENSGRLVKIISKKDMSEAEIHAEINQQMSQIPHVSADSFTFATDPHSGIVAIYFFMKKQDGTEIRFAMDPGLFLEWANLVAANLVKANQDFSKPKIIQ